MKTTVKVAGWAKLITNVKELEKRITRGAMREGMMKAHRIMAAAAKSKAPVGRTGLLKKSIKAKVSTNTKRGAVVARIGASTKVTGKDPVTGKPVKPANYLHLVEFGTAARGVYGKKGVTATPGNPPQPFMRQAFESTKEAVKAKYFAEMKLGISKAAAKIYKTSQRNLPTR